MNSNSKKELAITACKVRMGVIEGTHWREIRSPGRFALGNGHFDLPVFSGDENRPANPAWQERDRLVLSKGHTAAGAVCCIGAEGLFPLRAQTLRKIGSVCRDTRI